MNEEPYFLKVNGCKNCDFYKKYKEHLDNGGRFSHELTAPCLLMNCMSYGFGINHSLFQSPGIVAYSYKFLGKDSKQKKEAREYLEFTKLNFDEFYKKRGISIDDFIIELETGTHPDDNPKNKRKNKKS